MTYNPQFKSPPLAFCHPAIAPLGPIVNAKGQKEFHINNIVDAKVVRGRLRYRVRWLTYGPEADTWESKSRLKNTAALDRWIHYQKIPIHMPFKSIAESRVYCTTP